MEPVSPWFRTQDEFRHSTHQSKLEVRNNFYNCDGRMGEARFIRLNNESNNGIVQVARFSCHQDKRQWKRLKQPTHAFVSPFVASWSPGYRLARLRFVVASLSPHHHLARRRIVVSPSSACPSSLRSRPVFVSPVVSS